MEITVLGAGVSGLTTAIRLLEDGWKVRLFAKNMSPNTVSDVAAAWWYPFLAEPVEKTNKWSSETFYELIRLKDEEISKQKSNLNKNPALPRSLLCAPSLPWTLARGEATAAKP